MKTIVFTDRANPMPGKRIDEISTLLHELLKRSEANDPDVALNALLGAYVNLALKTNRLRGAAKAMQQASSIAQQVAKSSEAEASPGAQRDPIHAPELDAGFVNATNGLMDQVEMLFTGKPLDVVQTALLNLFMYVARHNPACTAVSAQAALRASQALTATATKAEPGATVH
ncbi:hypothetical protein [Variovorax atrisoli]|uniref:hypothetical protein n=1 Tax=Variovorax atrisoli TaxID=3394203 RepID=UPI003391B6CA